MCVFSHLEALKCLLFVFQLQDKLEEKGVNGVNLKWRKLPDGAVFHKEEKNTKKEEKKKTEL